MTSIHLNSDPQMTNVTSSLGQTGQSSPSKYDDAERIRQRMEGLRKHHEESADIYNRTQPIINEQIHEETLKYLKSGQANRAKAKSQKPRAPKKQRTAVSSTSNGNNSGSNNITNSNSNNTNINQPIVTAQSQQNLTISNTNGHVQQQPQLHQTIHHQIGPASQTFVQQHGQTQQPIQTRPIYSQHVQHQQQQQQIHVRQPHSQSHQMNMQQPQQQPHPQQQQQQPPQQQIFKSYQPANGIYQQQATLQPQQQQPQPQPQPQPSVQAQPQYQPQQIYGQQPQHSQHIHTNAPHHRAQTIDQGRYMVQQHHNQQQYAQHQAHPMQQNHINHNNFHQAQQIQVSNHQHHNNHQHQQLYSSLPNDLDLNLQAGLECDIDSLIKHEMSVEGQLDFNHDLLLKLDNHYQPNHHHQS